MTERSTRRALLDHLQAGSVSGQELADRLDVSRTAIWKHIESLRSEGFEIVGTGSGYVVQSIPEYGGAAVEYGLSAPFRVEYHERIGSTSDRARELAAVGAEDVVVLADRQVAGRGRRDRRWTGPTGGIYLSVVIRPALSPMEAPIVTLAGAVATVRALSDVGIDAGIKWPNDVLVSTGTGEERKIAGILTEMQGESERVNWIVLGIGINANVDGADLPSGSTSIRDLRGDVNRRRVVQPLLESFDELRSAPNRVLDRWRDHSVTLGRRVRIETTDRTIVGLAAEIESPGALIVDTPEGRVRVNAGDCEHLRPVD